MITKKQFGNLPDGRSVYSYTLTNKSGISAEIITFGGIIRSLKTPDKNGVLTDIVCGFETIDGYLADNSSQGALIGRYANRIKGGHFVLNGKEYRIFCNDGKNVCHGGKESYGRKLWDVTDLKEGAESDSISVHYHSPDGEEGFPGALDVTVTYTLSSDALELHYEATTDADTVCNMTNHAYFNLAGFASCDIKNHTLRLTSDEYTASDDELIPIENRPVEGTIYDFRVPKFVTENYDNNFMLPTDGKLNDVATLHHPESGRTVEVFTDLPGIQIYTANFLNADNPFKEGRKQVVHTAICLETQFVPDSPNRPEFPSTVLRKGEKFDRTTKFVFGVK